MQWLAQRRGSCVWFLWVFPHKLSVDYFQVLKDVSPLNQEEETGQLNMKRITIQYINILQVFCIIYVQSSYEWRQNPSFHPKRHMMLLKMKTCLGFEEWRNDNVTWDDPANTFFGMLQSSSWCWPTERTQTGENDKQHQQAERDSRNVSERSHWMKKCGSCRENLQLWPPFLTPVPFLWMINLYIVQCSQLQYDSHVSAENATSSSKIPQLSIYCYHFTSIYHRQMIIHTSCSLELNLKPVFFIFFADLLTFPFTFTLHRLTFGSISFLFNPFFCLQLPLFYFGSWKQASLHQALQPQNCCMLKIQEIGNLHNNYIKLWFMALFVIHLITCQPMGKNKKFSWLFYLNRHKYSCKNSPCFLAPTCLYVSGQLDFNVA